MSFALLGAVANQAGAAPIEATGGTETTSGDYTIHTFNSSGTFEVTAGAGDVEVLVLAGGGAGGGWSGTDEITNGGGGAGGLQTATVAVSIGTYTVTIGGGGSAWNTNGTNSVFGPTTSNGGGFGAWCAYPNYYPGTAYGSAAPGGSGGGGTGFNTTPGVPDSVMLPGGSGTAGQGNLRARRWWRRRRRWEPRSSSNLTTKLCERRGRRRRPWNRQLLPGFPRSLCGRRRWRLQQFRQRRRCRSGWRRQGRYTNFDRYQRHSKSGRRWRWVIISRC